MRSWAEIQQRLIDLGYDLGPSGADGDPGRFTREAVQKFQADRKVAVQWPGTVGPKTLAALFPEDAQGAGGGAPADPNSAPLVRAPWVQIGLRKQGLMETGKTKAELVKFLRSDGSTVGDPAKIPWCGDFVQTVIALALPHEPLPSNPYWARNWLNFGREVEPTFGAVGVSSRNIKEGHVYIILGEDANNNFVVLGGNQSNSISVMSKNRVGFLGARWPRTVDVFPTLLPRMKAGKLNISEV